MGIVIAGLYFTKAKLSIMLIRLKRKLGNIRCIHHRAVSPMAVCTAPSLCWDCSSFSASLDKREQGEPVTVVSVSKRSVGK